MMIDPPIDKIVDKVGCKYALVCLITKRARFLITKKPDLLLDSGQTAISFAAKELNQGKIKAAYED